ncbi:MAG: flagellar biosynthesis regulator FlaF [Rhodospirillaceae bacterium]|nr:flagellar biosynthesis regulator FlaF [Rhodospirillaceae bacterium]
MSNDALNAYDNSAKTSETGNETDAAVLEKAALMLEFVKKDPQSEDFTNALKYNQLIWTTIQTEMNDEHPLPNQIKANLISLAIFIDKQTYKAFAERKPELLDVIININRNIAIGLRQGDGDKNPDTPATSSTPSANIDV